MALDAPYKDEKHVTDLVRDGKLTELDDLKVKYLAYFHENRMRINRTTDAWAVLGEYLLRRASAKNTNDQTAAEFLADIGNVPGGALMPAFAQKIQYVQSDKVGGIWRLALPDKEFADQALFHTFNTRAAVAETYMLPPIFDGFKTADSAIALRSRICDYVLSHCQ